MRRVGRRRVQSAVLGLAVTLLALSAHANKYGEKHITKNTTLTDHQYGSVVFDADNISLDCNGYQVHISSYSKKNCLANGQDEWTSKCAIVAYDKSDISIKNCRVVGEFDYGVFLVGTENAYMESVRASARVGFFLRYTTASYGTMLRASGSDSVGLWLHDDVDAFFNNVVVEGVGSTGVILHYPTNTYFTELSVSESDGWGVDMYRGDGVTIADSEILSNAETGAVIRESDDVWFVRTDVQFNGYDEDWAEGTGIHLWDVHSSHFVDSNVTSNAPVCDVWQGPDSLGNDWSRTVIGNRCFYQEPR